MTMLKDDLVAQHYCRQLGEVMAAAKINKLLSLHISDWCVELSSGIHIGIKEKKGTTPELIKVDLRLEDLELFIKELQEAHTIFLSKREQSVQHGATTELNNELKSRKDLQTIFGGVSASTIDRFFKYLNESGVPYYKEALHGRSDVYRVGEMKLRYTEYQRQSRISQSE